MMSVLAHLYLVATDVRLVISEQCLERKNLISLDLTFFLARKQDKWIAGKLRVCLFCFKKCSKTDLSLKNSIKEIETLLMRLKSSYSRMFKLALRQDTRVIFKRF